MRVLRAETYRRMPWKNGGGVTTEIATSPDGASLDSFDWRISMARVEAGGPFSAFPGIDRTLSILQGEGLRLTVGDAAPAEFRQGSEPHAFAADVPTLAELIGGPVTDLNVMTRRVRYSHSVRRVALDGEQNLSLSAAVTVLFCQAGTADMLAGNDSAEIGPLDAVVFGEPAGPVRIASPGRATLYVIEMHRL